MKFKHMITGIALIALAVPMSALANHSVLVEGERDFDGDGRVGLAENHDDDNVFGTFGAALIDINNNGSITCVTSGRFGEALNLPLTTTSNTNGGNITVEAAPGVNCILEAFFQGNDPRAAMFNREGESVADANTRRQAAPGARINTPVNTQVTLRNLAISNWTDCVSVAGATRIMVDQVTCNNNIGVGLWAVGTAFMNVKNSTVVSQGFRQTGGVPTQNFPASAVADGYGGFNDGAGNPTNFDGRGVVCSDTSTCRITNTTVSGSCRDGLTAAMSATVILRGSSVSDSGVGATVCTGVDYAPGFDFSNFLPN